MAARSGAVALGQAVPVQALGGKVQAGAQLHAVHVFAGEGLGAQAFVAVHVGVLDGVDLASAGRQVERSGGHVIQQRLHDGLQRSASACTELVDVASLGGLVVGAGVLVGQGFQVGGDQQVGRS